MRSILKFLGILYAIIFLMIPFQVSLAAQSEPIECNRAIYCSNLSRGCSCGLLGDIEDNGKINIIREYTSAIYSALYEQIYMLNRVTIAKEESL